MMLKHRGYRATVAFDDDVGLFHGEVVGTRDVITFQAASEAELRREFAASLDEYFRVCAKLGRAPEAPWPARAS